MRGSTKLKAALASLAWGGLFLLVSRIEVVVARVPALGLLHGGLGLVLLVVCLLVGAAQLLEGRLGRFRPPGPRVLFSVSVVVLLGLGLHYAGRLRVTGDEPHYLLMAQSLWNEGDLDLRDNYARRDFREHTPGPIRPHYGAPRRDGRPYPAHSPGLPVLIAPAHALGRRPGVVIVLVLAAAALALQVRRLALHLTGDPRAALLAWLVAIGPPVALYSFHVYTEIPSALAVALGLRLLLTSPGPGGAAGAALAAGALPWLHLKLVPVAAALGLVALWRLRGRALLAFACVTGVLVMAFGGYYWAVFGSPSPLAIYGGVPRGIAGVPSAAAAVGLLLDRSFGLLPHAPVYLLALAGLPVLLTRRLRETLPHVLVAVAVLWPVLGWRMWWGGQCPPARLLVPLVPFLGVAAAARMAGPIRGLARWRWVLSGLGLCLLAFVTYDPGRLLLVNRGSRPTRLWEALSDGTPAAHYLPSLVAGAPDDWRVAAVWLGALGLLLVLDYLARRRGAFDRLFRGLGLPLCLLLLVGVLVDQWARPTDNGNGNGNGNGQRRHRGTEVTENGYGHNDHGNGAVLPFPPDGNASTGQRPSRGRSVLCVLCGVAFRCR